jgi:hypothetical protein
MGHPITGRIWLATISIEVPARNVFCRYLSKEVNGPNMPAKVFWAKMEPSRDTPWSLSFVRDHEFDGLVERFWDTYHRTAKYLERER